MKDRSPSGSAEELKSVPSALCEEDGTGGGGGELPENARVTGAEMKSVTGAVPGEEAKKAAEARKRPHNRSIIGTNTID